MLRWIRSLDHVLRGETTSPAALSRGGLEIPVWGLCVIIDTLGLLYGLCMGVFAISSCGFHEGWKQAVSCMLKVPALYILTLLVTFPSLYVFNAMVGCRLTFMTTLRLMVAALAVMLAVLTSIGPIVAFFSFTTTSAPFMVLLNVVVFATAGLLGMRFLLTTLHRVTIADMMSRSLGFQTETVSEEPVTGSEDFRQSPQTVVESDNATVIPFAVKVPASGNVSQPNAPTEPPRLSLPPHLTSGPLDHSGDHAQARRVRGIFHLWVCVFGLVGAQMAWVLSPFIAHPGIPFMLFRPIGSNFFQGVLDNVFRLIK